METYKIEATVEVTIQAFNESDATDAVREALLEAESLGATVDFEITHVREVKND